MLNLYSAKSSALWAAIVAFGLNCTLLAAAPANIIKDGDFERTTIESAKKSAPGVWVLYAPANTSAKIGLAPKQGRNGSTGVSFQKATTNYENIHFDQIISVKPDTIYQVSAWVRGDGKATPLVSAMTMGWYSLAAAATPASADWTEIRFVFQSFTNTQIRLEFFPMAAGKLYSGAGGATWLDDVSVIALDPVPPALARALALAKPAKGKEIDVRAVKTSPVGNVLPLRPVVCKNGTLQHEDGSEVAWYGVNFQTALSWEYRGRMQPCGVPETAAALKEIADRNLAEIQRMQANVIRMHLLPADFSDAQGGVRDSLYLDSLEYTIAECSKRGIYVYLTLMNEMKTGFYQDSFLAGHDREEWVVNEDIIQKSGRYVRELLQRKNRYSGVSLKDEPALAVIEIMNEPRYITYDEMRHEARFANLRERFAQWHQANPSVPDARAAYLSFRYEYVRDYVNRMCGFIKDAGARQPVAWNLNWPGMVAGHEEVYQAIADSAVAAISFCIYPGQSDVPHPYYANPAELSDRNYLPYLKTHYTEYAKLRWLLGERFAGKAKCVYEFESMYNQSGYLYPAIASLFRAFGAQIAMMWTYNLSPTAEYHGGSHYLNLYCTPQKTAAFCIASALFRDTPRYTPYAATTDQIVTPHWAASFTNNLSVFQTPDTLMYSRSLDWQPWPINPHPKTIVGLGDSPLVNYAGTGLYFIDVAADRIAVSILPDVNRVRPHWKPSNQKPRPKSCLLDSETAHPFALKLPGWEQAARVSRLEAGKSIPVARDGNSVKFLARPGAYVIERR